jgi:cobalt/nickel transport system ATP-binding protein
MNDAILNLDQVNYRYGDGTRALDNCSLTIKRGARTAVLGANGAGKTTMFLHLNGILRPDSGTIRCDGHPLDYSRSGLRTLRSRVGMVFQNPDSQLFSASVREDVSFGPMNIGLEKAVVAGRVEAALSAVGMLSVADKPVHNLSYGQKKRVCIAGVLAMQPDILVLDEPMAGLDITMQYELTAILDRLHRSGMSVVIATHDLDFAYGWADETLIMAAGQLRGHGAPTETLQRPDIQQILGSTPLMAELCHALLLRGIDLRANGYVPRSREELLAALAITTTRENTP